MAERIISAKGIPLTGPQIIDFAKKYDELPYENYGTIVKALQARISEDIAKHRKRSRFVRTGVGTYFLRNLTEQHTIYGEIKWNPTRASRKKPEHPHRILTVPRRDYWPGFFQEGWNDASDILAGGKYAYQSEIDSGFAPVVTGAVLAWQKQIYTFQLGVHTFFEGIVGQRTAIVRKFLDEFDLDLFETDGTGATSSTARTVLPILADGRRARLQSGKLTKAERLQFFQVAEFVRNKSIAWSETTGCFVLLSVV
ncbi:MAG: hypothetical protein V7703_09930, partial [Hyphomicrobiales bacterium]